jgi:hypothetical protein
MMAQDQRVVRAVAEVLAAEMRLEGGASSEHRFYEIGPEGRSRRTSQAECLLDALDKVGYQVVSK